VNRPRIEALWLSRPTLTIEQVRRATGAPSAVVRHVRAQLIAAGRLRAAQRAAA
jgi:hypothetical protein